ncbi:MAG TPA: chemotaxis protein CheW [Planctomycetota bacterium]|nr:chemotaxis protein CheW [Planctomycetota bacterium]
MIHAGLVLICRMRHLLAALPLVNVRETMRPLPVQPLTGVPFFVRGMSVIRGVPMPVVDAGALLDNAGDAHTTRFVTVRAGEHSLALAVESVVGIRELPTDQFRGLPPLLGSASAHAVSAVSTLDAEMLVMLQVGRVVPDSVWLAIEACGVGE